MSDDDDWMKLADDDAKIEIKKVGADEEQEVEFIDKHTDAPIGTTQAKNEEKDAKKNREKDLGKKYDDKRKVYEDTFNDVQKKKGLLTQEDRLRSEALSKQSDARNAMELFGDLANETAAQNLNDEKAFVDYAKKVGAVINQAALKRHIQEFIKQLVEEVYPKLTSAEFQEISDKVKVMFNQKQKDEKPVTKGKKNKKPTVNMSKGVGSTSKAYDDDDDDDDVPAASGPRFNADDDFM